MQVKQRTYSSGIWNSDNASDSFTDAAQLVLLFGSNDLFANISLMGSIQDRYPSAEIIGCSTAGEIYGSHTQDSSLVETPILLDRSSVAIAKVILRDNQKSFAVGARLAAALPQEDLIHVFTLSDGLHVNGSELVNGMRSNLPPHVSVTGGLSADAARFQRTTVYRNGETHENSVVAIGFYGKHLHVGFGSYGGWDPFGPERLITRADGNVLYELDGESALSLYKRYLGPQADTLPAGGLRFPLSVRATLHDIPVVRTILAVDEKAQSLTFAGDIPLRGYARLMRSNVDRLVDGATQAAKISSNGLQQREAELAILISCVGRKLVLQQRADEEVEAVRAILGERPVQTGFYSYGEIAPFCRDSKPELHNQTMTVTLFAEDTD